MTEFEKLNAQRRALRQRIIDTMKTYPSMELSETLSKVDDDIEFWENQNNYSITGLIKTIKESLKRD